jgi:hypothetical protein
VDKVRNLTTWEKLIKFDEIRIVQVLTFLSLFEGKNPFSWLYGRAEIEKSWLWCFMFLLFHRQISSSFPGGFENASFYRFLANWREFVWEVSSTISDNSRWNWVEKHFRGCQNPSVVSFLLKYRWKLRKRKENLLVDNIH